MKDIIVCSNCGLTKREHNSFLFIGMDGKYCRKFREEIKLTDYKKLKDASKGVGEQ